MQGNQKFNLSSENKADVIHNRPCAKKLALLYGVRLYSPKFIRRYSWETSTGQDKNTTATGREKVGLYLPTTLLFRGLKRRRNKQFIFEN